jgi:tetrahydromethanopterin S-methyltransferase subunit E
MSTLVKVLIILAGLTFLLAVFTSLFWGVFGIPAESFSRASNNLGIIAIALLLLGNWKSERK